MTIQSKYCGCGYLDHNCHFPECNHPAGLITAEAEIVLGDVPDPLEPQEMADSWYPFTGVNDPVEHPAHYTDHPSGIECIQITEHMGFNLGNVVKYVWRADLKHDAIEDLRKAKWYIEREIAKRMEE